MKNLFVIIVLMLSVLFTPVATAGAAQTVAVIEQQTVIEGIFDIQYPVVTLENRLAADKINAVLAEHVARFRAAVDKNTYTQTACSRYEVHHNADDILSLTMTDYVYTGGAHGMSYKRGYTFDLASGELYRFNDLIPDSERDRLNREIAEQIVANEIPQLQQFTGIKTEPDFYLLPGRKIVIFYQLYELAPYAWGFVAFPLNY